MQHSWGQNAEISFQGMNTKEINSIYAEFLALPYSLVLFLIETHRIIRGLDRKMVPALQLPEAG